MFTRHGRFLAALTALTLAALACSTLNVGAGGDGGGAESDGEPAGGESSAAGESAAPGNPDVLDLDDPGLYVEPTGTNYTVALDFNFTAVNADGSTLFRQILLNGQRNQLPAQSYFRFEANDPAVMDGLDHMEIADLEGTDYVYSPGTGCLAFANQEYDNPYDTLADTGGLLTGEARRVEIGVVVNGVAADRYEITVDNLDPTDAAAQGIRSLEEGSLYLARADGALVRLVLAGRGVSELLTGDPSFEGDIHYQLDITPTGEIFTILPPEECQATIESAAYPMPEDARDVTVMGTLTTYTTDLPFEELVEFYKSEMAALGYSLARQVIVPPTATLSFSLGGVTLNVLIAPNAAGTGSTVLISP